MDLSLTEKNAKYWIRSRHTFNLRAVKHVFMSWNKVQRDARVVGNFSSLPYHKTDILHCGKGFLDLVTRCKEQLNQQQSIIKCNNDNNGNNKNTLLPPKRRQERVRKPQRYLGQSILLSFAQVFFQLIRKWKICRLRWFNQLWFFSYFSWCSSLCPLDQQRILPWIREGNKLPWRRSLYRRSVGSVRFHFPSSQRRKSHRVGCNPSVRSRAR